MDTTTSSLGDCTHLRRCGEMIGSFVELKGGAAGSRPSVAWVVRPGPGLGELIVRRFAHVVAPENENFEPLNYVPLLELLTAESTCLSADVSRSVAVMSTQSVLRGSIHLFPGSEGYIPTMLYRTKTPPIDMVVSGNEMDAEVLLALAESSRVFDGILKMLRTTRHDFGLLTALSAPLTLAANGLFLEFLVRQLESLVALNSATKQEKSSQKLVRRLSLLANRVVETTTSTGKTVYVTTDATTIVPISASITINNARHVGSFLGQPCRAIAMGAGFARNNISFEYPAIYENLAQVMASKGTSMIIIRMTMRTVNVVHSEGDVSLADAIVRSTAQWFPTFQGDGGDDDKDGSGRGNGRGAGDSGGLDSAPMRG